MAKKTNSNRGKTSNTNGRRANRKDGGTNGSSNRTSYRRSDSSAKDKSQRRRDYIKDNPRNYQDDAEDKQYLKGEAARYASNDDVWYDANPELTQAAANFVYGYPAGTQLFPDFGNNSERTATGGVYVNYVVPSIGYSSDETSPVNIAAMQMFNAVRREQTGTSPFEQTDLMMMTVAVAEVYSYIVFLQRLYGTVDLVTFRSKYVPETLFKAQQVNLRSVQDNRAAFRAGINLLIHYAAAFKVPANVRYFQRKKFMYANLFTDSADLQGTIYMNVPAGFFWWKEGDTANTASMLEPMLFPKSGTAVQSVNVSYKELLDYGFEMIHRLRKSESVALMSAAILKAYGDSGVMSLVTMPEIYPIVPLYDEKVLYQFKNAIIMPYVALNTSGSLPPSPDVIPRLNYCASKCFVPVTQKVTVGSTTIQHTPQFIRPISETLHTAGHAGVLRAQWFAELMAKKIIMSSPVPNLKPATAIEFTRLQLAIDPKPVSTSSGAVTYRLYAGTEIIVESRYYYDNDGEEATPDWFIQSMVQMIPVTTGATKLIPTHQWESGIRSLLTNGRVDYSPQVHAFYINADEDGSNEHWGWFGIHFDFNNIAIIHLNEAKLMNEVALLSLFEAVK